LQVRHDSLQVKAGPKSLDFRTNILCYLGVEERHLLEFKSAFYICVRWAEMLPRCRKEMLIAVQISFYICGRWAEMLPRCRKETLIGIQISFYIYDRQTEIISQH
jgi:hypothetical protein